MRAQGVPELLLASVDPVVLRVGAVVVLGVGLPHAQPVPVPTLREAQDALQRVERFTQRAGPGHLWMTRAPVRILAQPVRMDVEGLLTVLILAAAAWAYPFAERLLTSKSKTRVCSLRRDPTQRTRGGRTDRLPDLMMQQMLPSRLWIGRRNDMSEVWK